jgi:agmatine deiminase
MTVALLLLASCNHSEDTSRFYHPAEFEPTNSTCFIWTTDYYGIIPRLAGIISRQDQVTLFIGDQDSDTESIKRTIKDRGGNPANIHFMKLDKSLDNIWIRDFGPVYMINRAGEKKLVKFNYFWSEYDFIEDLASKTGVPIVHSPINSTGGSREVNGQGTMILCEAHEKEVNRGKSKEEIEQEMMEKLGQKKIIWLKQGIPQDDSFLSGPLYENIYPKGVHGHVDEFCRFVDEETILITGVTEEEAQAHPVYKEAKKRLDENFEILVSSTDQDGKSFRVVQVPMAPVLIHDRRAGPEKQIITSVTSYMNFIISNSLIVLPSYVSANSVNKELQQKEAKVEAIFKDVFPNRDIIKLRADTLNYYSGGFHCISIHEPLVKK